MPPDCDRIRAEHVTVTIGEHNRNVTGTEVQTRRVLRMMPHQHFTLNTFVNDIAVLELDSPVDITTPAIRPACLPLSGQSNTTLEQLYVQVFFKL